MPNMLATYDFDMTGAQMDEQFDTFAVADEAEQWELKARQTVRAVVARRGGVPWLGERTSAWLLGAVAVAASLVLALQPTRDRELSARTAWAAAIGPSDPRGRAIANADRPPALGAIMLAQDSGRVVP